MQPGRSSRISFVLVIALMGLPLAHAGSLEGTWRLVDQRYERGGYNFVKDDEPFVLELTATGERLGGRLSWHEGQQAEWPAYPTPNGPATLHDMHVQRSLDGESATATYRVEPSVDDDTWLVVKEEYRLAEGDRMESTMEIRFERNGKVSGGFTWKRTFEREAGP
ncbi:MAG: hypothetical protein OEM05_16605 [Myxococcales bacterium]|nr:hypothetical protein [Myxococcales bacterium]